MKVAVSLAVVSLLLLAGQERKNGNEGFNLVDKEGNIRRPEDFLDRYQALGTYLVLDPKGNEMHVTYGSSGAAENYRRAGKFADGTVLVKEVFGTDHAQMTTGDARWAKDTKVWFVLIKDSKGRRSEERRVGKECRSRGARQHEKNKNAPPE